MATRIRERYEDGVLVSSEEVEVEDQVTEVVEIPKEAVTKLAEDMADPSINSISELKVAVLSFVEKIGQ